MSSEQSSISEYNLVSASSPPSENVTPEVRRVQIPRAPSKKKKKTARRRLDFEAVPDEHGEFAELSDPENNPGFEVEVCTDDEAMTETTVIDFNLRLEFINNIKNASGARDMMYEFTKRVLRLYHNDIVGHTWSVETSSEKK